jgi:hypothetical protein
MTVMSRCEGAILGAMTDKLYHRDVREVSFDAVVVAHDDPSLAGLSSIAALRGEAPWVMVSVVIPDEGFEAAREAGAEVLVAPRDAARLPQELARALASTS